MEEKHNSFLTAMYYFYSRFHFCGFRWQNISTASSVSVSVINVQNQLNVPQLQIFSYTVNQTIATDSFIFHVSTPVFRKALGCTHLSCPVYTTGSLSEAKGTGARSSSITPHKYPGKKTMCSNSMVHV
jgi:hypothetical protein